MLQVLIEKGLRIEAGKSDSLLGDRSEYIGASDISACPRKVILSKLEPTVPTVQDLLRYERGHLSENIVSRALASAGLTNFTRQAEFVHDADGTPVRAHLDFLIEASKSVGVLEVKTVSSMPDTAYPSWEFQLYLQMGLVKLSGETRPIKGAVLAINLNEGTMRVYNSYTPNDAMTSAALARAKFLWDEIGRLSGGEITHVDLKCEVGPLCGFCPRLDDCPAWDGEDIPELEETIAALYDRKQRVKALQDEIDAQNAELLKVFEENGITGRRFRTGPYVFQRADRTRTSLRQADLMQALPDFDFTPFQSTTSFSYLEVRKPKAAAPKPKKEAKTAA